MLNLKLASCKPISKLQKCLLHFRIKWPFQNYTSGIKWKILISVFFLKSKSHQFSSVHSVMSNSLRPHELQHARPPYPSQTPRVYSNSCPSSRWCHPATSSSVIRFSSCPQSLPASGSFPMSQLFTWGGQSTGVSASASVLPMNTQDWCPLAWTGWISLQSKGLSRVCSNTIVQKHQFFSDFTKWDFTKSHKCNQLNNHNF